MSQKLRYEVGNLLIDGKYTYAISFAFRSELHEIKEIVIKKGLIEEAELCAKSLEIDLKKDEYEEILLIALENIWIYTFLKCERRLCRLATDQENTTMLNGCIEKGWLKESEMFSKRLHRTLTEEEVEMIMYKCISSEYWFCAYKCAVKLPEPKRSSLLRLISYRCRLNEPFWLYEHNRDPKSLWIKTAV